MTEIGWALPAAIALTGVLAIAAIIVLIVRVRRRTPQAQATAARAVDEAEAALLRLDDAANDLDLAFDAADALPTGDAPADLRRARASALRARDRAFVDVASLRAATVVPTKRRADAERLRAVLEAHLGRIEATREPLEAWSRRHRGPAELIDAARRRRDETVETAGDPGPLVRALSDRFDDEDWRDAAFSARAGIDALAEADAEIALATAHLADTDAVAFHVRRCVDATRRAGRHLHALEDAHRIALQAADNVAAELSAARTELRAATEVATARPEACAPDAAARLREAAHDLEAVSTRADRHPRASVETVARAREMRDELVGEAVSARTRLELARAALPGTLACARAALATAEARTEPLPIDARLRLDAARRELAAARTAIDPAQALANARAAWHAAT
ncbi:hypothetical protein [Microbacterium trichothecenolyticum]|uniref:Septation ring formation regulator EzrA n=1 Tax=Microbacterium trichothecenolyticum TaxID=69370 RepID=A0ABU0TW77_MICTR|nr:hypothetical protein [Microbacterium trichothecenolyticum]MDQ1123909.1 hypothetical protein [Microbacterium trichothecenolyticum]